MVLKVAPLQSHTGTVDLAHNTLKSVLWHQVSVQLNLSMYGQHARMTRGGGILALSGGMT